MTAPALRLTNATLPGIVLAASPLNSTITFVEHLLENMAIGLVAGGIGLPLIISTVPFLLGFTVGGIVQGSIAASCMACHGGYVPIGGFVATMQSVGEMGCRVGCQLWIVCIGSLIGVAVGIGITIQTA